MTICERWRRIKRGSSVHFTVAWHLEKAGVRLRMRMIMRGRDCVRRLEVLRRMYVCRLTRRKKRGYGSVRGQGKKKKCCGRGQGGGFLSCLELSLVVHVGTKGTTPVSANSPRSRESARGHTVLKGGVPDERRRHNKPVPASPDYVSFTQCCVRSCPPCARLRTPRTQLGKPLG